MPLPYFLARPIFHVVYWVNRAWKEDFPHKRPFPVLDYLNAEIEEWGSTDPVIPLARIKVQPDDFPYLSQVQFNL